MSNLSTTETRGGAAAGNLKILYRLLRFGVAFFLMFYGFAKLNGAQFTILNSELDKPMGQVSGFWLTWYYFGYSPVYGNLIGVVQILGAVLLMFRKTTLLGTFLLLPVIGNILLVNIFYQIDLLTPFISFMLLCALLGILAFHREELVEVFWRKQNSAFPDQPAAKFSVWGKYAVRALLILTPALYTYWVANYNNRLPTPLDGVWNVVSIAPQNEISSKALTMVFFERNRAFMCVFKRQDGSYEQHHFEIDQAKKTITIWEQWLEKGNQIFDGTYEMTGDELRLSGKFHKRAEGALPALAEDTTLVLKKRNQIAGIPREHWSLAEGFSQCFELRIDLFKARRLVEEGLQGLRHCQGISD